MLVDLCNVVLQGRDAPCEARWGQDGSAEDEDWLEEKPEEKTSP